MPRHDDNATNVQAEYNTPQDRIISDARGANSLIVLAMKNGKPVLWATDSMDKAQELVSQYFPSAVLPETTGAGFVGSGSDR